MSTIEQYKANFRRLLDEADSTHTDMRIDLPIGLSLRSNSVIYAGNVNSFGYGDGVSYDRVKARQLIAALEIYLEDSEAVEKKESQRY